MKTLLTVLFGSAFALSAQVMTLGDAVLRDALIGSSSTASTPSVPVAGDVLWAQVQPDGWTMKVAVKDIGTNGAFNFGFETNNTGTSKVALTLTSMGFDDTGAATTVSRTVYGTKELRYPYPNQAATQITNSGTDAIITLALSDYIYAKDSNVTCSVGASWYSNNNATASVTVTNNSAAQYPKTIGNWTWPGFNVVGSEFPQRAVAFNRHGQQGRPVRCVKFVAADAHGNSNVVTVTSMVKDGRVTDAVPFAEFVGTNSTTSLTDGDLLRCNFIAYPWIGDSGSVLNTDDGAFLGTKPLYHPETNLLQRVTSTMYYAVVDGATGNDTTGYITNTFNASGPPLAFATIVGAANKIVSATNEATIYLKAGNYHWADTHTPTALPKSWTVVTAFPGASPVISNTAATYANLGNGNAYGRIKVDGVTIQTPYSIWYQPRAMWFNNCKISVTAAELVGGGASDVLQSYWTGNTITNLAQGLKNYSTTPFTCDLIRGNTVISNMPNMQVYTDVGNFVNTYTAWGVSTEQAGTPTYPEGLVIYNNKFQNLRFTSASFGSFYTTYGNTNGAAVVQNLVERASFLNSDVLMGLSSDGSTGNVTNILVWNNTWLGSKCNLAYNDNGTTAWYRVLWSQKNNLLDDYNIKTDTFGTQSGNRVGNWPVLYGVGNAGNCWLETTDIGAPGQFLEEFGGLGYYKPASTSSTNWPAFVSRKAADGVAAGAGNGDYRLTSASPVPIIQTAQLLPYDLNGYARGTNDPPGAFAERP